jgi:CheY-like chemotaxis protein
MSCRVCTGCVLIVEDDPDTLDALREVVTRLGCRVLAAQDGIDALDRLRSAPAAPCLVLTDLNMPRLDGAGFAAYLRHVAAYTETPLVTMSADRVASVPAEADAHLVKPFVAADLCRRIAGLCRGGPAQSASPPQADLDALAP